MTDLSPAAKAVLDVALDRWLDVETDSAALIAAAALRAVADQLTFKDSLAGAVINPRELLDIAAELENV